jgi:hypothetical protein
VWAEPDDLATHLGVTSDARVESALEESLDWCQKQRPDLDPYTWQGPSIRRAVVTYGGLLYRERSSPQGFAAYDQQGGQTDVYDAMANVYRLLRSRRPVAR